MPITADFLPDAGLLTVLGDNLDDSITIGLDLTGTILVNDGAVSVADGPATVANTNLVQVFGQAGNDTISVDETNGLLPALSLSGGAGDDTISGGHGDDLIIGGTGDDQLSGGGGNDRFVWNAGDGNDVVNGGFGGSDTLEVNGGAAGETFTISRHFRDIGVEGADPAPFSIAASSIENVVIHAGGGNDTITADNGLGASLTLDGGAGNDTITGGDGADSLIGGAGNDLVDGKAGADVAFLGAGDDIFRWDPGDGSDVVEGQAGHDTLLFNGSGAAENIDMAINGDRVLFTRDVGGIHMDLHGIESIVFNGLGGADNIVVNDLTGTDVREVTIDLAGAAGGGNGAADQVSLIGGNNRSHINVAVADGVVNVYGLSAEVTIAHSEAADRLTIHALAGNDTIDASSLTTAVMALVADGGAGNDRIIGGDGADVIDGGLGKDQLTGGGGNDQFVFDTTLGDNNVDTIADFTVSADKIVLDHRIFDALPVGQLTADAFFEGKTAHAANDRIIYDDKSGKLFYDADGRGGADAVLFAKLDPHLDLSHSDFLIV